MLPETASEEDIRQRYLKLTNMIHPDKCSHPGAREAFEAVSAGQGLLVKRVYKLADEEQPFGLRWFIPEFLKLRGLFGQIAMAVLMINAIALIPPLSTRCWSTIRIRR